MPWWLMVHVSVAIGAGDPVESGRALLRSREYARAVEHFSGLLESPDGGVERRLAALEGRCEALTRQALAERRVDLAVRAVEDCSERIRLDAGAARVWRWRGVARLAANQPDQALINFNHALRLQPDDPVTLQERGVVFLGLGRHSEAESDFSQVARLEPQQGWWHFNQGLLLARQGKNGEAVAAWREFIRLRGEGSLEWLSGLAGRSQSWPEVRRVVDLLMKKPGEGGAAPAPVSAPVAAVAPAAVTPSAASSGSGGYLLRLGSFQDRGNLATARRTLDPLGWTIREEEVMVGERRFYRLMSGPYPNEAEARQALEQAGRLPGIQPEIQRVR
ncbi:MAG: hypothetical protein G8237_05650 [Magnetococcales bacterium]|nr:hypothetical protein [Magnetococcales bacterium]